MDLQNEKQLTNSIAPSVIKPFAIIEKELSEVTMLIHKELRCEPNEEGIRVLLRHIQARSAKMLRPGMVLLSGLCCGDLTPQHIKAAAIFEMIHNATLLHDDVIDQANKRRGSDTVNILYGNESAVLLGDFLLTKVFSMSPQIDPAVAQVIAQAAEKTCRGEINQNLQKDNWQLSENQYIRIISDKTAAMFGNACLSGALLAGCDDDTSKSFANFGLNLGIAFQLADDLLDLTADERITGKKGCDIENSNATLGLIRLISTLPEVERAKLTSKLQNSSADDNLRGEIDSMLLENDCLNYTKNKIIEYKQLAIDSISSIRDSDAKKALIDTANFVTDRCS